MRRLRAVAAVVLGVGFLQLCGTPATAQTEGPLDVSGIDAQDHPEVSVRFTPPPELHGRQLTDDDVVVFEDGSRVPLTVERLPADGLDVVLVVDTSGSMRGEPMEAAKAAARDFVLAMPPGARMAVVGFGSEPQVASPFGTDPAPLVTAVEGLAADGETALYDALALGGSELRSVWDDEARQFVVLLSDGGDTTSARTLDETVAALAESEAGFFAVALATSESDLGALGTLAQATDGKVIAATDPSEIAGLYDAIASQLVNQYEIRYTSATGGATSVRVVLEAGGVRQSWEGRVQLPDLPAPALPEPVAAEPFTAPEPAWTSQGWWLLAGVVPFALALGIAGWIFFSSQNAGRLAERLGAVDPAAAASTFVGGMSSRATALAERALADEARLKRLDAALERAGLAMRPAEYLVLSASVVVCGALVAGLMFGPMVALAVGAAFTIGSVRALGVMKRRRQARIADQLGDTLQLLAGSLRSGHGLMQALDMVSREAESPTAEEFHRVITEARLGRDLSGALDGFAERSGNEDVEWVVQAIRIHREVGGDLAEILDRVGETIRDRNRVRGQIRSLTAEGRLSAILLMALPFLVGTWMWFTNREYVAELFNRSAGRVVLLVGAVLMTLGALAMRRLVRPEF